MLYSGFNEFGWSADNFNSKLFANAGGAGTDVTTGAANTKGSPVEVLSAATLSTDVFGLYITLAGGTTIATRRNFLTDILIDPAGGTNWTVLIPNLLSQQNAGGKGCGYYFPGLFIPAGSSIAAQSQCNLTTITHRVGVKAFGKPTRPELLRTGNKVEAIGVDTVNTQGVQVTPGNDAWGSWASLGTPANENWWWQAGICCADTTMSTMALGMEVSGGDAANKKILVPTIVMHTYNSEEIFRDGMGLGVPACRLPAGDTVYGRMYSQSAPDATYYMTAYGVS